MKTLYLECNMGAAGDMLMAALLELHPQPEVFLQQLNGLGLPGVEVSARRVQKCGIFGTHVSVRVNGQEEHSHDVPQGQAPHPAHEEGGSHSHPHPHPHGHAHSHPHEHGHSHPHEHEESGEHAQGHSHHGLAEIEALLRGLPVPEKVQNNALAVYRLIAEAEGHAHGVPVSQVHFHEVGQMDAVADILGVCLLIEALSPEVIVASPVHVGSGQVRCAHGVLPVPAPATAHLLRGVPIYGGGISGELCTPTGAALLKHFVERFGPMPEMTVSHIGYGMGKKDFEAANCLRAYLGEGKQREGAVVELLCNLDDMTPEAVGYAQQQLMEGGALDAYTVPIGMKKGRPAVMLGVICAPEQQQALVALLFAHTTTLGVRANELKRYTLGRSFRQVDTPYGPVSVKISSGYGVEREKPEYEDLVKIARQRGKSLMEVQATVERSMGLPK